MAAAFVANGRPSPILDTKGKLHQHIRRQAAGYKRTDPPGKHEKAMPPIVFRYRMRMAHHKRARARAHLLCGAVFFAMRSCEYTYVGTQDRKTRPIEARDITFMIGNRILDHDDPALHRADSVSINFGDQKSEIRNEEVTQYNNDDPMFNPVIHWASTIRRLQSYPNYDPSWPVFTFYNGTKFSKLTSTEVLIDIRAAVSAIGPAVLGFTAQDVGTHSVRSSFAMMAYLAKEPVYTIMLIGRWSSTAFLRYIEKQVKEFTRGVSKRMLAHETFFHVAGPTIPSPSKTTTTHQSHRPNHNLFGRQGSLRQQLRERN